jgi:hypothetical protein
LPKFQYRPILEKIQESYLENAKQEYKPGFDIESNIRLVIEADSQELADLSRYGFVDIRMWELVDESQSSIS